MGRRVRRGAARPDWVDGRYGSAGRSGGRGYRSPAEIAALQAQVAALIAGGLRFLACADGLTVADAATGLLWERKTGSGGVECILRDGSRGLSRPTQRK